MRLNYTIKWLILLISILLFSGCTKTIYVYPPTPKCIIPQRPYLTLVIDSTNDLQVMKEILLNLNKTMSYSKELETTIDCYQQFFKEMEQLKENKKDGRKE